MSKGTVLLIKLAILGILVLIAIAILAYAVKHESDTNRPFKVTVTRFQAADADLRIFGAKIAIKPTRHSRLVGIVIDKQGSFTELEKEIIGRSAIRLGWGGNIVQPVGVLTPDGALELRLPGLHFLEAGDETLLGLLVATSCTQELATKNAKVTFDLLGIIIRDDENRLVRTEPPQVPKLLTVSCGTSI